MVVSGWCESHVDVCEPDITPPSSTFSQNVVASFTPNINKFYLFQLLLPKHSALCRRFASALRSFHPSDLRPPSERLGESIASGARQPRDVVDASDQLLRPRARPELPCRGSQPVAASLRSDRSGGSERRGVRTTVVCDEAGEWTNVWNGSRTIPWVMFQSRGVIDMWVFTIRIHLNLFFVPCCFLICIIPLSLSQKFC